MVPILSSSQYQEITVRLWGKGVVSRGSVAGISIAGDRRFLAKAGQLILSRIDARNGAIGIVPADLNGAVVSNDFPLFDIDESRLCPSFFYWLTKSRPFVDHCARASEGTTNRVRLKEDRFLDIDIPLPDARKQATLATLIYGLNEKIGSVQNLRNEAINEVAALAPSLRDKIFSRLASNGRVSHARLGDVVRFRTGYAFRSEDYSESGPLIFRVSNIRENGEIDLQKSVYLERKLEKDYTEYQLSPGDILMVMVGGSVGKLCMLPEDFLPALMNQNMWRLSPVNDYALLPRYLFHFLHWCNDRLKSGLTNSTHGHLTQTVYKAYQIPVPDIRRQREIVNLLDSALKKANMLIELQAKGREEISAMLPRLLDGLFESGRIQYP